MSKNLKIFIICGEESGEFIAFKIASKIKSDFESLNPDSKIVFYGLGGKNLATLGLKSLFDISQLSVIGFVDVIKNIFKFKRLIKQTANEIAKIKPDIVISVDSGGFCFRVCSLAKNLLSKDQIKNQTKFYHCVAPAVWAYGNDRGKKLAKIYDAIFCLFAFEPPYFTKHGLDAIFIGNNIFNQNQQTSVLKDVFLKYNIQKPVVSITLGSRRAEVLTHIKIIRQMIELDLKHQKIFSGYHIAFLTLPRFENIINKNFEFLNNLYSYSVITLQQDKNVIIKNSSFAIAKSGTNVMEFLLNGVKTIVFYKTNLINYLIIKLITRVKFANIINIIEGKMIVKEFVQFKANPKNLLKCFTMLKNGEYDSNSKLAFKKAIKICANSKLSEEIVSNYILKNYGKVN